MPASSVGFAANVLASPVAVFLIVTVGLTPERGVSPCWRMFTCAFQVSPAPTPPSGGERPAVAQPPASALVGAARARSASGMSSLFMRNNLLVVVPPTPAGAAAFRQR